MRTFGRPSRCGVRGTADRFGHAEDERCGQRIRTPCFVDIVWVEAGKFGRPGVECALSVEVSEISGWETLSSRER